MGYMTLFLHGGQHPARRFIDTRLPSIFAWIRLAYSGAHDRFFWTIPLERTASDYRLVCVSDFYFTFLFQRILSISILMLIGAGWGFMALLNMCNALVQTHVADELRAGS